MTKNTEHTSPAEQPVSSQIDGPLRMKLDLLDIPLIESYLLSPMQQGMLYHFFADPTSGVDVEQIVGVLHEDLDYRSLRLCLAASLRSTSCVANDFSLGGPR